MMQLLAFYDGTLPQPRVARQPPQRGGVGHGGNRKLLDKPEFEVGKEKGPAVAGPFG